MRTRPLKIIATIVTLSVGIIVYVNIPFYWTESLVITTLVGIFVWILVGRVFSSEQFIRLLLWFSRVKIRELSKGVHPINLESAKRGFFILEAEEKAEASLLHRLFSHVFECLERPWIPILFLASIEINLVKILTMFDPSAMGMWPQILFFGPIILGFIMPGALILLDSTWQFFKRSENAFVIEKSSGFFYKLLQGFVGGVSVLGLVRFAFELWVSNQYWFFMWYILAMIIICGAASHSIVWILFFYLFFHRRFVQKLNTTLEKFGLPRVKVYMKEIQVTPVSTD